MLDSAEVSVTTSVSVSRRTPGSVTPTESRNRLLPSSSSSENASVGSSWTMMSLVPGEVGVHCQLRPRISPGPRLMVTSPRFWLPADVLTTRSSIVRLPMLVTCREKVTCSFTCGIGSDKWNELGTNAASGDRSSTPAPRTASAYVCCER